jgi:hypothetical protein
VLADTTRVFVPMRDPRRRHGTIGMHANANAFDAHPSTDWMPATQYSWALLRVSDPVWYAEIDLNLRTSNRLREAVFRQWVPFDAVRLPTAEETQRYTHQP